MHRAPDTAAAHMPAALSHAGASLRVAPWLVGELGSRAGLVWAAEP